MTAASELESSMKLSCALGVAALSLGLPAALAADIVPPVFKAPVPVADWSGFYVGAGAGFRSTDSHVDVTSARDTRFPPAVADPFRASNCYVGFPCVTGQQFNAVSPRFAPYIGYNWQCAPRWVLGIEGDVGFGSQTITRAGYYPATPFGENGSVRNSFSVAIDWDASIRARIGYLVRPGLMVYATGGPSWLHLQSTSNCSTSPDDEGDCAVGRGFVGLGPGSLSHSFTKLGATVGGGLEA